MVWIALNFIAFGLVMALDTYPYSQARQSRHAELRAKLDYEVNVRSYRKLQQLETTLGALANRLDSLESR